MKGIEELDIQSIDGSDEHRFQYNGKEKEESFGLHWNDHGARSLDVQLGRWNGVDPLAEKFVSTSSYVAMLNNPIRFVDLDGRQAGEYYNENGRHIGSDGNDDNMKYVVTDNDEARTVRQNNRRGNDTSLDEVTSAVVLPSDAALSESLDVLQRTIDNGGKKEESSLVMKDGLPVRGKPGEEVVYGQDEYAGASLPDLPEGTSIDDVEASIHSHPTKAEMIGTVLYSGNALEPTLTDAITFSQFEFNIIVGPLGQATAREVEENGTKRVQISEKTKGVVIYKRGNPEPAVKLSKRAVERIISEN